MFELQYFYHSFFRAKLGGKVLLFDPFFDSQPPEKMMKKNIECPIHRSKLTNVDAILVSHEHFDHFDKDAIEEITKQSGCTVIAHDKLLQELNISPRNKQSIDLKKKINFKGIDITPLPAHHPSAFYPMGFKVEYDGMSMVHTGDTNLTGLFAKLDANVLCVPIGGVVTMDVVDAVRAVKTMEPDFAVPMHYGTFDSINASPAEFKEKIEKSILKTKPVILKPGMKLKI